MYQARPKIQIKTDVKVQSGYAEVFAEIVENLKSKNGDIVTFECYPGLDVTKLIEEVQRWDNSINIYQTDDYYKSARVISEQLQDTLTDDRVFGKFSHQTFMDFIDESKYMDLMKKLADSSEATFLIGVGASQFLKGDIQVYCNMTKWEIQKSFREGSENWQANNAIEEPLKKIKRSYYFEWPAADEIKKKQIPVSDYVIDCSKMDSIKMIDGKGYLEALNEFTRTPFRLVPYFDPGVWGGKWMQEKFDVDPEKVNLAWSFDGVPEENSVIFVANDIEFEVPGNDIVFFFPKELLGERVYGRFGSDFPIRFDYLDTMGGGNLSLQVHPTLDYAYRKFGLKYTQDESYYIMDCAENAYVYLGLKDGVEISDLVLALEQSQITGEFDAEEYINKIPVKPHDHFLIPAGTIHCSGRDCVVLEISTTPNRFTFKLWDWGRTDLDGKPRPIHINHGKYVINDEMRTEKVQNELVNAVIDIKNGDNFREEKTGLHKLEPIETRRHYFTDTVLHSNHDSVNMLNLVQGDQIMIESTDNSFEKVILNYGETFIIPEAIKQYKITPLTEGEYITMKAFIR
ncbi:class I mannose-6-phosphate isomerase [Enterococcus sp.]|uniref:class I mannose-6-phosphate isomerase n=1 Tax=Enterococcus sp. TaxID=35783 RepID=UPI003C7457A7